jgi:eukaryotic-like serine/threonine-protein kinase
VSDEHDTEVMAPPRFPRTTKLGVGDVKPLPDLINKTVLDRYLVEGELGKGAMGKVYRGRHIKLGREVAIKVLHYHLVNDKNMLGRFRREAQVAARLSHGNVISVLDVGETEGTHLIVFELARGSTLRRVLDTAPLPAARIIQLVGQILRGLDHAHGAGLIHRDLKPENIIIEPAPDGGEVPRIVDFGVAALRDPEESVEGGKLTASGVIVGTPLYMAPEQAKGEEFDHRIDLFALGVVVYEMLAGVQPFEGSAIEIALANIGKDPPPITERVPGIPPPDPLLELFARKLMARRLADRFPSAHAALQTLELIERDRDHALLALGQIDIAKALAVVSLPEPPKKRR